MLASISIENFRCIRSSVLDLDGRGTGIVGPNASGKTSFLEAIYFLAHGRSFRTSTRARMVGPYGEGFRVSGRLRHGDRTTQGGVEYSPGGLRIRMAGQELSGISALSQELPVQIIDPSVHRLIEEGSTRRRRLMDWGVFHVKQEFVVPWRRYQRALMQRNAAVRTGGQIGETEPWSSELQQTGQVIDELRSRYVAELQPMFESVSMDLLGFPAELVYHRGWAADTTLGEALRSSAARESRLRTTVVGAHRADLEFRIEGRLARDRVSRGQQKMIAVAFVLAQIALKARTPGIAETCLLLDDPAAELDVDNLGKLLKLLEKVPAQLVITALHQDGLNGVPIGRVFHVEQGNFSSML